MKRRLHRECCFVTKVMLVTIFLLQLKKNLVTASYVDDSMSKLDQKAKDAGITILGEMGLDPGIGWFLIFFKLLICN